MNFIEGTLTKAKTGFAVQVSGAADLPASVAPAAARPGEPVTLGIRPEHLRISEQGIPAEVALVEWLGNVRFAYLSTAVSDEPIIMQMTSETQLTQGQKLMVSASADNCHLFNSDGTAISRTGYDPGSLAA